MNRSLSQCMHFALRGQTDKEHPKTGFTIFLCSLVLGLSQCIVPPLAHAWPGDMQVAWSSAETDFTQSVAWGDWDNDGDLDLAVGNMSYQPLRMYKNEEGTLVLAWSSTEMDRTNSVAWGDWDGDGDLDLAVGNEWQPSRVYENTGGSLSLAWSSPFADTTWSVAWGDWDGDGDLDLAMGNSGANRVYRNDTIENPGTPDATRLAPAWSSPETDGGSGVAWGDWDEDGDLDLAAGLRVYENAGGTLVLDPASGFGWDGGGGGTVAWGDWDNDADLDLAVGNAVYENTGGSLSLAWTSPFTDTINNLMWGDGDGDGDLDLAVGSSGYQPNRVYENMGGNLSLVWSSPEVHYNSSIAWGDWDGDGDLDLVAGNWGEPNQVHENVGTGLSLAWSSAEIDWVNSVAWGDWDGDGDLDLAVGNHDQPNRVYRNVASSLALAWASPKTDSTNSLAWGDWDGDGDLDLAVGNADDPSRVYENTAGSFSLAWSSPLTHTATSVAWADWDGDSDLDLAVGSCGTNRVYRNDSIENPGTPDANRLTLAWSSPETNGGSSVAWGDWDGDGDLDLAAGLRVYENNGETLLDLASGSGWDGGGAGRSVAWADWDSDGDLDLAFADGEYYPIWVYENVDGNLAPAWFSAETDYTSSVAWADWDGDGDLDLGIGNVGYPPGQNRVYENTGSSLSLAWTSPETDYTTSVAWGDWDGDADPELAVGNDQSFRVYLNHSMDLEVLVDSASRAQIAYPGGAAAPFFSSSTVFAGPTLPITYTLLDGEGDPVRLVEAYYSLDGGSTWRPAVAASGTLTTNLDASPGGTVHTYTWDLYASGVFGASDNAVFRFDVYQGFTGPGPYQYPFHRVQTLPFRVRGSQIRVLNGTAPVGGAVAYHRSADETGPYRPYFDRRERPLHTNLAGYLQGYGEIAIGDQLVALSPITHTEGYALYYTNASPTPIGLDAYTVTALGVQTLTVSADNPLVLFNPTVSLEWDARQDEQFLSQLEYDLRRTSELLYDWSNGQAALGKVTIYHDRQHWNDAYIRIYASNALRPNAAKGGIVTSVITDPLTTTVTYGPGQVRMGATWNRYGDPGGSLGEDWPRTLAHELGHFALFLDDDYLGLDGDGFLIPVDSCLGTAMTDPYRDDYSEFHPDDGWLGDCEQTLSHQSTGRSDWSTISTFYPALDAAPSNPGPSTLPLAVTDIQFVEPITPPATVEVPIFYLYQDGSRVQPGSSARAFLFQGDRLIAEGRPTLDQVVARGARYGDRLCLFEPDAERLGCETVTDSDQQLELIGYAGWQPEVVVTPVMSRTIALTVANVPPGLALQARLFPANDPAPGPIVLTEVAGQYAGIFDLAEPAFEGYVHVWVDEGEPRRETVTDYALGGNPGRMWARFAPRGSPGRMWARFAPVMSSDGQMMLYGENLDFEEGEFFSLQAATSLPSVPGWATVVGRGYRLGASPNAPDLSGTSVSFGYLGNDVPAGEEDWLRVYYWDGIGWQPLPTQLDTYHNMASAPTQGPRLYALMSSIELPLYGPGWNLISYPIQETRPVTVALLSISGYYTTVYGYEASDPDPFNRWRVYDVTAPPWVNDLEVLQFARGYWINVSQDIMLRLKGAGGASQMEGGGIGSPPATYYGEVLAGDCFTPTAGMTVTAWIDGHLCGQDQTMAMGSQTVYVIGVAAEGPGGFEGCGAPGRLVTLQVESQRMQPMAEWDNSQLWELPLSPVCPPAVSFQSTSPDWLGATTTFTNTTAGSEPITYTWSFGDSASSSEVSPTHVYTQVGSYTVLLTGTNPAGIDVYSDTVLILGPPDAGFESSSSNWLGETTVFTNTSTGPGPINYLWSFGDGATSTTANPTHTYSEAGLYTVVLTATNGAGSDTHSDTVIIYGRPEAGFASSSPDRLGQTTYFTNITTGPEPIGYQWSFGDGATETAVNPTHIYSATGIYTVTLTATNPAGSNTYSDTVIITERPVAHFLSSSPDWLGETTVFTNTTAGIEPLTFQWSFGDGTTGGDVNPAHLYSEAGSYTVVLTATNPVGNDAYTDTVVIYGLPEAGFTSSSPDWLGETTVFTNTTTTVPPGDPTLSYEWSFGDGLTSTLVGPTRVYAASGVYVVVLTASNMAGTDVLSGTVIIYESPEASFTAAPTEGEVPLTVIFTNMTVGDYIDSLWDFGDSVTSTLASPTHTYEAVGVYTVTLMVRGPAGSDTAVSPRYITATRMWLIHLPLVLRGD